MTDPSSRIHSPSSSLGPPSHDNTYSYHQCGLNALPSELHLEILSYLNFRDLQMFRATNKYFRSLHSSGELAYFRSAYVRQLFEEEAAEVADSAVLHSTDIYDYPHHSHHNSIYTSDDNEDDDSLSGAFFLTCYTCLRTLYYTHFSSTQRTRRRSKGHADAMKRFCKDCGLRDHKWGPGALLEFPTGLEVYCRRCRQLNPCNASFSTTLITGNSSSSSSNAEWSRLFGLCYECRMYAG